MNNAHEPAFPMLSQDGVTFYKGLTKVEYMAMQIFPTILHKYGSHVDEWAVKEATAASMMAAKKFFELTAPK